MIRQINSIQDTVCRPHRAQWRQFAYLNVSAIKSLSKVKLAVADSGMYRLIEARYRRGIASFLAVLDAQRPALQALRLLAPTQLAAANRVALYRTLGGDALTDVGPKE